MGCLVLELRGQGGRPVGELLPELFLAPVGQPRLGGGGAAARAARAQLQLRFCKGKALISFHKTLVAMTSIYCSNSFVHFFHKIQNDLVQLKLHLQGGLETQIIQRDFLFQFARSGGAGLKVGS